MGAEVIPNSVARRWVAIDPLHSTSKDVTAEGDKVVVLIPDA
jgi:hypothetical protein